jgi:putative ABC transport system permease protein
VALAVILLVGAGLFLASFWRVSTVGLGFEPEHVLTVRIRPLVGRTNYDVAVQRNRDLLLTTLERVRSIPGVEAAALVVGGLPLRGDLQTERWRVPGLSLPNDADIPINQISADYFRVLQVPLLKGRFFTDADRDGTQPVVLLNEAAARKYFGEDDPVGRTVNVPGPRTIVGVVGNIRSGGPEAAWGPGAFVPLGQSRPLGATLVMRIRPETAGIVSAVKTAVWSLFPEVPIPDVYMLEHYLDGLIAQRHFVMLLLGCFGLLAIVIAGIGIYGVMGYVVRERTQEIGIRVALGALPSKILWSVLGRASLQVVVGLALGAVGAWALSGLVGRFLFQVQPHDPRVYTGAVVVLVLTALAAALVPARRAAHVDPLTALRMD